MRWAEALKWALTTRPKRLDSSWFWRRGSSPSIDSDLLLIIGVLFGVFIGLGLMPAGMGWLGLFAFLFVIAWALRAAHHLEREAGG